MVWVGVHGKEGEGRQNIRMVDICTIYLKTGFCYCLILRTKSKLIEVILNQRLPTAAEYLPALEKCFYCLVGRVGVSATKI